MDRTATATIEGFNYQYNKSILEILNAKKGTKVMLEGLIEDIDIVDGDIITAIQCKYYESQKRITPSSIAKAVFDMLVTHIEKPNINFKLYIHIDGESEEKEVPFDVEFLNEILKTNDKNNIKKYFPNIYKFPEEIAILFNKRKLEEKDVEKIKDYIQEKGDTILLFNKQEFINKFTLISALKNSDLKNEIIDIIIDAGNEPIEVVNIIYPNFFQKVAEISSYDNPEKRNIIAEHFKQEIYNTKELIYTKWLAKLYDKEKYKKTLEKRLKDRLKNNSSFRVITINVSNYSEFEIAVFINEYINKFCQKPKLNYMPLFMIRDDSEDKFLAVQTLLYSSYGISVETGEVARKMNIDKLFQNSRTTVKMCMHSCEIDDFLSNPKSIRPDDIIVIGELDTTIYKKRYIPTTTIEELNIDDLLYVFSLGGK